MSILTANIPVPSSGDGLVVSVSGMVGTKNVQLSGRFAGYYDLLASHDDADFVAVASFDAGGPEGIKTTINGAFKSFRLRSSARQLTTVVCEVSAVAGVGQNGFGTVASLGAGFSGLTPIVDTSGFAAPDGSQEDTNFICRGSFEGAVVVLGSIDGVEFNPVGEFRVDRRPEGSPSVVELTPLLAGDNIRYVRLLVGLTTGPVVVTFGGRVPVTVGPSTSASIFGEDSTGRATTLNALGEEILYEEPVNLGAVAVGAPLSPKLSGVVDVSSASLGTFRLYIGSTTPGSTVGATLVDLISTSSLTPALVTGAGSTLANPGGTVLVQITGVNNAPATCVSKMYSNNWRLA
jgi:hypothetical protein